MSKKTALEKMAASAPSTPIKPEQPEQPIEEKLSKRQRCAQDAADELLCVEGHDDAILGVAERYGSPGILIYDKERVLSTLMDRDGMTSEEAEAFYDKNLLGAWMGNQTPLFLKLVK